MDDPYTLLQRVVEGLNYRIGKLPKPINIERTKEILRPVYETIKNIMGEGGPAKVQNPAEDEGKLYIDPDAPKQSPAGFMTPPSRKRSRPAGVFPPGLAPLADPDSPGPPPAPKKAGRRTRRQRKSKH